MTPAWARFRSAEAHMQFAVFFKVFWYAESIVSIRIGIGATEATSEAAETAKLAT